MSSKPKSSRRFVAILATVCIAVGLCLAFTPAGRAQGGLSTGSIQGTIVDPGGASVAAAKVTITSKATGSKIHPDVSPTGTYNSGPLIPGDYLVRVEAPGFKAVELAMTIQV